MRAEPDTFPTLLYLKTLEKWDTYDPSLFFLVSWGDFAMKMSGAAHSGLVLLSFLVITSTFLPILLYLCLNSKMDKLVDELQIILRLCS